MFLIPVLNVIKILILISNPIVIMILFLIVNSHYDSDLVSDCDRDPSICVFFTEPKKPNTASTDPLGNEETINWSVRKR